MTELLTWHNIFTLLMLILLQAVLGFDNLLYISLESKKAPEKKQSFVRKSGIGIAIVLRIVLLFILTSVISFFQDPIFSFSWGDIIEVTDGHYEGQTIHSILDATFNIHSLIVLVGGGFIIYTAVKEIWHMISHHDFENELNNGQKSASANKVIAMIVVMNLVFSFDSILSAMALTNHIGNQTVELILMSIAIIASGVLMILLADKVSKFLQKNRMYEVLGLFILFIVGIMLLSEGGHLAGINILGSPVEPMNKTTFYFVIAVLVLVDVVQSKYQKNLIKKKEALSKQVAKNDRTGS